MNFDVPYGFTRRFPGVKLGAVREKLTAALAEQGFGILTEIDVQATLEKKIGVHVDPYVILGACNPKLAHQAISKEPAIGLLLPCNVVVAQDGQDVVVSVASPRAMFAVAGKGGADAVSSVAEDAEARLRRALDSLNPT